MKLVSRKYYIVFFVILVVPMHIHDFTLVSEVSSGKWIRTGKTSPQVSEQAATQIFETLSHAEDSYDTTMTFKNKSTSYGSRLDKNFSLTAVSRQSMLESFVFPSVEERISYYMGSYWSNKSISGLKNGLDPRIQCYPEAYPPDSQAVLQIKRIKSSKSDIVPKYFARLNRLIDIMSNDTRFDLLVRLGDGVRNSPYPVLMKARAARPNNRGREPILLPFDFSRHYGPVLNFKREYDTIMTSWNQKTDAILWRGSTTGPRSCFHTGNIELCDRLRLVRKYHNISRHGNTKIDIGFSNIIHVSPQIRKEAEKNKYARKKINVKSMLRYKYLISVQGNDVATDLKWKLYSNSVVFMKPPTVVTWAMEDKLVPFYHYIPLADDYSDLLEKLEWAGKHEEECKKIARQATEYIEALVASDQARIDEKIISTSILKSYQWRFGHSLSENCREQHLQKWQNSFLSWKNAYRNASFAFPSVDQRIKYYMGSQGVNESFVAVQGRNLPKNITCSPNPYKPNSQAIFQMDDILHKPGIVGSYFGVLYELLGSMKTDERSGRFALLVQLGDAPLRTINNSVPVMTKSRVAQQECTDSILLPFDFDRHYGDVFRLKDIKNKVPDWEDKRDTVLWRGRAIGPAGCFTVGRSSVGICERLRFIRKYSKYGRNENITYDIGISSLKGVGSLLKSEVQGYVKENLSVVDMAQFKYLISLEGHGVDKGLTWKLYSNSVVFMKPPKKVSWAMEDTLVPFHHYIPLADDFSDLPVKLEWAHNHQEECQQIAAQATKYIESLLLSDQAIHDQQFILRTIINSYQNGFGQFLSNSCFWRKWERQKPTQKQLQELNAAGIAWE